MRKKKHKLPPKDSWITLRPGESVHVDAEFEKRWERQIKDFREVRGHFLASCFEIEYQVDLLLGEILFPGLEGPDANPADKVPITIESGKALKELFDELILKRASLSPISFGFKIELLKEFSSQISILQSLLPEGFGTKLDKVRKIRNRFAHYPITFNPVGDPPNQSLSASLVCRDKTILLDVEFLNRYSKLFGDVTGGLEETLERLRGNTSRV